MIRAFLATAAVVLTGSVPAWAACDSDVDIDGEITCSDTVTATTKSSDDNDIGTMSVDPFFGLPGDYCGVYNYDCYSCGSPYAPLDQIGPEDVYEFTCQADGDVTLDVTTMDCDFDIYVLDSTCDPYSGCEDGSTGPFTGTDSVTFTCSAGSTYYVVIEAFGYYGSGSTACSNGDGYTFEFDVSAGTGCAEDCDNGVDDDLDGDVDCDDVDCDGDPACGCDEDSDGYDAISCGGTDCDDADASINPGASEACNGVDDDCDGSIDEGVTTTYYADSDSDGYGDASTTTEDCSAPTGYVSDATDCDDGDRDINPGEAEVCNGIDDDCDSSIDEGVTTTYYADSDGDDYGDADTTTEDCSAPSGYVSDSTDCDDDDAGIYPGADEYCNGVDDDCDTEIDEDPVDGTTYYADDDGDTYGDDADTVSECSAPSGYVEDNTDCDDNDNDVYPGAPEICNGEDDDCNGLIDDGATGAATWYADDDGDSYGDASDSVEECTAPSGYVSDDTDCDDTDDTIYPGAVEVPYDGIDQDCDGVDLCDVDGDGYDWDGSACGGTDCDDNDADIGPGATENPDGRDEDCDGIVDEGTIYYDDDGDGITEAGGDCDDGDDTVRPGEVEDCDGVDDDCDGIVDEETDCYDDDGDGWTEDDGDCNDGDVDVNPDETEIDGNGIDDDCDGSTNGGLDDSDLDGYTEDSGADCDDDDATVYEGAPELPDGIDNDCDGIVDEGTENYDDDGDGYAEVDGDCNDADADISPDGVETADGTDEDCDGTVDEGTDRFDDDGDGFTEEAGDCDDADPDANPTSEEIDNGIDDDCDGEVDEGLDDLDDDGWTKEDGDCNDSDGWVHPEMSEMCDGIDNDCDGSIDEECTDETPVDPGKGGCGCQVGGLAGAPWLLVGLLALGRRRRR